MNREVEWIYSASEISALENCCLVSLEAEIFYSMTWMTLVSTSEVLQVRVKPCQSICHGAMNYKSNKQGEGMGTNAMLLSCWHAHSHVLRPHKLNCPCSEQWGGRGNLRGPLQRKWFYNFVSPCLSEAMAGHEPDTAPSTLCWMELSWFWTPKWRPRAYLYGYRLYIHVLRALSTRKETVIF